MREEHEKEIEKLKMELDLRNREVRNQVNKAQLKNSEKKDIHQKYDILQKQYTATNVNMETVKK